MINSMMHESQIGKKGCKIMILNANLSIKGWLNSLDIY